MKYLKKYTLFENLESKIDLQELDDLLIDFKQMGLDDDKIDIKVGSSVVIDWANKVIYVLEFKRTSDQRRHYREGGISSNGSRRHPRPKSQKGSRRRRR